MKFANTQKKVPRSSQVCVCQKLKLLFTWDESEWLLITDDKEPAKWQRKLFNVSRKQKQCNFYHRNIAVKAVVAHMHQLCPLPCCCFFLVNNFQLFRSFRRLIKLFTLVAAVALLQSYSKSREMETKARLSQNRWKYYS